MKKNILFLSIGLFLLAACGGEKRDNNDKLGDEINACEMFEEIVKAEKLLFQKTTPDTILAKEMINKYISYVNSFPNDSLSPDLLFKAAEIAMNFGQPANAVNYLSTIEARYKDYSKYASSMFLKAFIFDYYLNNKEQAEKYYKKFIENFPEHSLIDDAKAALMFINMEDEELIRTFEQIN